MPRVAPPCSRSPDHRQSRLLLPVRPASGAGPPQDWAKYSFLYSTTPRLEENPWSGHRARSKKVTPTPAAIQVKTARRTAAPHDPACSRTIAQHRPRPSPGAVLGFGVGASTMPVGETGFVGQGSPANGTVSGGGATREHSDGGVWIRTRQERQFLMWARPTPAPCISDRCRGGQVRYVVREDGGCRSTWVSDVTTGPGQCHRTPGGTTTSTSKRRHPRWPTPTLCSKQRDGHDIVSAARPSRRLPGNRGQRVSRAA